MWRKLSSIGFGGHFLKTIQSIYTDDSVQCEVNGLKTRQIYLRRGLRQGCSLSPLLFNLYISTLGHALTLSNLGIKVGRVYISGLLFADDLVVIARTKSGLLKLIALVKRHADALNLNLNTEKNKSEVLAQTGNEGDTWDLVDACGATILSLKQVMQYKYLGTQVYTTMAKTVREKLKQCESKARQYKGSCISISHDGPDVVDMIVATWCNIAVPSILFGCEMIPFTDTVIDNIERIQSQIAKYALGLPSSAANICAQTELGFQPSRRVMYGTQLHYYNRVLSLSNQRWVKQALDDHMSMQWESPYIKYLLKIRTELGLISLPRDNKLNSVLNTFFINKINCDIQNLSLPGVLPMKSFSRLRYTSECAQSECIAKFRYNIVDIGHRIPRPGTYNRKRFCPLCPVRTANTPSHVAFFCPALEHTRKHLTSISSFRNMCSAKYFSEVKMYQLYLNGKDWNEVPVDLEVYIERGKDLQELLDDFNSQW